MADDDARFGNEFCDESREGVDGLDAIVNEIDLTIASEFVFDGVADQIFAEGGDDGLNGEAVAGRRFDQGHVPQADQRHV